jgi:hypothetical protein
MVLATSKPLPSTNQPIIGRIARCTLSVCGVLSYRDVSGNGSQHSTSRTSTPQLASSLPRPLTRGLGQGQGKKRRNDASDLS